MDCGSSDGARCTDTYRTPMRRDQRSRASDHRAGREPRAAGIEHSAHYAAAFGGGQWAVGAKRLTLDDGHRCGGPLRIMSGRYV
jgi:hypothetical protein